MNEAEAMAQEIAAERSGYVESGRSAFRAGWEAAMEYLVGSSNHWESAFQQWWSERTAEGYDYSYEPLENVKFGFEAGFEKGHRCRG